MTELNIRPNNIDIEYKNYALHGYLDGNTYKERWWKVSYLKNGDIKNIVEVCRDKVPYKIVKYLLKWMTLAHKRMGLVNLNSAKKEEMKWSKRF